MIISNDIYILAELVCYGNIAVIEFSYLCSDILESLLKSWSIGCWVILSCYSLTLCWFLYKIFQECLICSRWYTDGIECIDIGYFFSLRVGSTWAWALTTCYISPKISSVTICITCSLCVSFAVIVESRFSIWHEYHYLLSVTAGRIKNFGSRLVQTSLAVGASSCTQMIYTAVYRVLAAGPWCDDAGVIICFLPSFIISAVFYQRDPAIDITIFKQSFRQAFSWCLKRR